MTPQPAPARSPRGVPALPWLDHSDEAATDRAFALYEATLASIREKSPRLPVAEQQRMLAALRHPEARP